MSYQEVNTIFGTPIGLVQVEQNTDILQTCDATDSDIDYLTANVTFKYTIYNISDLDDNIL